MKQQIIDKVFEDVWKSLSKNIDKALQWESFETHEELMEAKQEVQKLILEELTNQLSN